jgi:hypothetical protein
MDWIDLTWDRDQQTVLLNIKCREILDQLSDWRLLKKGSAPYS